MAMAMESMKERFKEFKARRGEAFLTLIKDLFFDDDGEFFNMVYKLQEKIEEVVRPQDLNRVYKRIDKWISRQPIAQQPCLMKFFGERPVNVDDELDEDRLVIDEDKPNVSDEDGNKQKKVDGSSNDAQNEQKEVEESSNDDVKEEKKVEEEESNSSINDSSSSSSGSESLSRRSESGSSTLGSETSESESSGSENSESDGSANSSDEDPQIKNYRTKMFGIIAKFPEQEQRERGKNFVNQWIELFKEGKHLDRLEDVIKEIQKEPVKEGNEAVAEEKIEKQKGRVTPSIQHMVKDNEDNKEHETNVGGYMEFINKQVDKHADAILKATQKLKEIKKNPQSIETIHLPEDIFGSPEISEEELDDVKEISLEIIPDSDKEEKEENQASQDDWMAEIRERIDQLSKQRLKKVEEEESESCELFGSDSESEVVPEPDSDWKPERNEEIDEEDGSTTESDKSKEPEPTVPKKKRKMSNKLNVDEIEKRKSVIKEGNKVQPPAKVQRKKSSKKQKVPSAAVDDTEKGVEGDDEQSTCDGNKVQPHAKVQRKTSSKKRKAPSAVVDDTEKGVEGDDEQSTCDGPTKRKRAKRLKVKCVACGRDIVKSRRNLVYHYGSRHKSIPNDIRDEQINIVMKKSMPIRKDGTRSTDIKLVEGMRAVKDDRVRTKICMFCDKKFSYTHLNTAHLELDSPKRCKQIPDARIRDLKTEEEKKQWKSDTIRNCEKANVTGARFREIYAGSSLFTTDELLDMVEEYNRSYQGKFHVDLTIKKKLADGERLDPEEYKINYRPRAVRNLQKRVMDHIFCGRQFKLSDLSQLCRWMKGEKEEHAFMNSRLVPGPDGKNVPLSHSTIASLARSMIGMLEWVKTTYSDSEVQEAATKAISAMRSVERTATKKSRHTMERRRYLDRQYFLVPIKEIQKLIESEKHTKIIQGAVRISSIKDEAQRIEYVKNKYTRETVFDLQCHIAVLLTLHTGKRPGVLCGIKLQDVFSAKQYNAESRDPEDEDVYSIRVTPNYEYAVFKTVPVAHIIITETFLILLEALSFLRQVIDRKSEEARLLTSRRDFPLTDIWELLTKAWADAGCKGRFNSTMMRHTIVTKSRDVKKNLSVEEIKALARGMDHSVRIAEKIYYNEKEKRQIDHSSIIRKVLALNDWEKELKEGVEEEIEKQVEDGEINLIDPDLSLLDDDDNDDGEEGKKKKIGNMEVIFTSRESDLVRQLFESYINAKVKDPKASIKAVEIKERYYRQMRGLPKNSPFFVLDKYPTDRIVTKVRTLITQDKRRKKTMEKRQKSYKDAHISNIDHPKL